MIVPSLLVGSIENIFGFLLGILFSLVIPSLTVDSLYAAYYVHKYPDYE
ncbi:lipoprotein [Streptococcus agalactiae]|nr:lipoprotein [Streptococcus agalactiae]